MKARPTGKSLQQWQDILKEITAATDKALQAGTEHGKENVIIDFVKRYNLKAAAIDNEGSKLLLTDNGGKYGIICTILPHNVEFKLLDMK